VSGKRTLSTISVGAAIGHGGGEMEMMVAVNKSLGQVEEIKRAMIKNRGKRDHKPTNQSRHMWSRSRFFLLFFFFFGALKN